MWVSENFCPILKSRKLLWWVFKSYFQVILCPGGWTILKFQCRIFFVQGLAKSRIYPWYKYELYSREVLLSYFDSSSCYLIMFQKCSNVVIISQMFLPSKRNWSTSFWDQDYIFALNKWCLKCDNWQVSMVTVKSQYKGLLYTCKKTQQNKRQGGYNCTTGVQG